MLPTASSKLGDVLAASPGAPILADGGIPRRARCVFSGITHGSRRGSSRGCPEVKRESPLRHMRLPNPCRAEGCYARGDSVSADRRSCGQMVGGRPTIWTSTARRSVSTAAPLHTTCDLCHRDHVTEVRRSPTASVTDMLGGRPPFPGSLDLDAGGRKQALEFPVDFQLPRPIPTALPPPSICHGIPRHSSQKASISVPRGIRRRHAPHESPANGARALD